MFAEIRFITLSCWCHLLFPGRERKVQARQQRRRMTDRRRGYVIEHARSMILLTSLCNMSLLTCTQHPAGNSNHIRSQYSDLSGSCNTYKDRLHNKSHCIIQCASAIYDPEKSFFKAVVLCLHFYITCRIHGFI